ncbi:serine/threonine kinase [Aureococcus anophagefferens]|nr:serine/threonine kinase [Aureococcus anophagefferens]
MAAPENTSNGFPNTEVAGDMSVEAQDVRIRQYERLCENLKIQRRQYDSLKEVHQELLWSKAVLAHDAGLAVGLPAVDESLVEEAHRVGDVATGAARLGRAARHSRRATTCFVVERFGEELYALLKRDETALTSAQQAGVVHGVAAGLAHMHSLDLVHRDVKPENVLLVARGGGFWDVRVKLCDLGLSTRVRAAPSPACCCGSLGFFAPDMLDPAGYDGRAADAWSLGCLALELAAGRRLLRVWFREYKAFFALRGDRDGEHGRFVANLAPLALALRGRGELAAPPDVAGPRVRARCRQSPAFTGAKACLDTDAATRRSAADARHALAATYAP